MFFVVKLPILVSMFARSFLFAVILGTSCSSVAMAQLLSDVQKSQNEENVWVPESVLYVSPDLPKCMDLGSGCLGENLNYDKVKDGIEWDKCRNGDKDCYLTKNVKNAEPFVKALVQPFIYNHEKRERQSGESPK